jgi:hypothetical protein
MKITVAKKYFSNPDYFFWRSLFKGKTTLLTAGYFSLTN